MTIPVYIELGAKRAFACALDWPGWCRSGRDEEEALQALAVSGSRYAAVAGEAGIQFPKGDLDFEVVEGIAGSATTDFGAPGALASSDSNPLRDAEAERLVALVGAAWRAFDQTAASAPRELRKGPRGGGRDTAKIVEHVIGADTAYARKLGVRQPQPSPGDSAAVSRLREAVLEAIREDAPDAPASGWPARYAARRIAWHALDHAWEIEDRSQ